MSTPTPTKVGAGATADSNGADGGIPPPPPPRMVVKRGRVKFDHNYARNFGGADGGGPQVPEEPQRGSVEEKEEPVPGPSSAAGGGVGSGGGGGDANPMKEAMEQKYVDDFIDANDGTTNDVARNLSKLLEVNAAQENIIRDAGAHVDALCGDDSSEESLAAAKEFLLKYFSLSEQLGTEGAEAAQAIEAAVSDKAYELDMDHRILVNGPIKAKQRRGSKVGARAARATPPGGGSNSKLVATSTPRDDPGPSYKKISKRPFKQQKSLLSYDTLSKVDSDSGVADSKIDWGGYYRTCQIRRPPVYSGMCISSRTHSGNVRKKNKRGKTKRQPVPMGASNTNGNNAEGEDDPKPGSSKSSPSVAPDSSKKADPAPGPSSTKKPASAPKASSSKSILLPSVPGPSSSKKPTLSPIMAVEAKDLAKMKGDKAEDGEQAQDPNANGRDSPEPLYCVCDKVSFGKMVSCDNDLCPMEWFHFKCVGMKKAPKENETWYCPMCRGENAGVMKEMSVFIKDLEAYYKRQEEQVEKAEATMDSKTEL